MLRNMFAVVLVITMTHGLSAQTDNFSNKLGKLFEAHANASIKCSASEDYDSSDCQNEAILIRSLMDSGWCRETEKKEHLFQRCSVYRSYTVSAELSGYQFGFEDRQDEKSFSTEFTSFEPTLSGTYESETAGKLHLKCSAGSQPLVVVELEKSYPNFAIRSDLVNFVAVIKDEKNIPMARALLSEENSKGMFFTASSEIAIRILEYYSKDLEELGGDKVTLTFNTYEPRATIEFSLMPLFMNFEAMKHSKVLKEHVNALLSHCRTALK